MILVYIKLKFNNKLFLMNYISVKNWVNKRFKFNKFLNKVGVSFSFMIMSKVINI